MRQQVCLLWFLWEGVVNDHGVRRGRVQDRGWLWCTWAMVAIGEPVCEINLSSGCSDINRAKVSGCIGCMECVPQWWWWGMCRSSRGVGLHRWGIDEHRGSVRLENSVHAPLLSLYTLHKFFDLRICVLDWALEVRVTWVRVVLGRWGQSRAEWREELHTGQCGPW